MTNGRDDNDLLRLDVVDSVPSKPSEQAKSTSLSKCPVFPTYVLYFNFSMWSKVMIPLGKHKEVDLRHDGLDLDTPSKHACRARKGSHSSNRIQPP